MSEDELNNEDKEEDSEEEMGEKSESPVPEELSEDIEKEDPAEESVEERKEEEEADEEKEEKPKKKKAKKEEKPEVVETTEPKVFALRTTANREDQVMDFITSNIEKKKDLRDYSVIRPNGMRGYIFVEAATRFDAEQAAMNIPYARGILPKVVEYSEMEHMLEQVKQEVDIRKNDIAEIIAGPFKREQCKVTRIDKAKEEVVVELLEAAVPIPITVKMDAIKVIRREGESTPED
ncbi:MAG: transcription elongation factor Spt5 [Candidatus Woesearchaeota archaeon]|nr:transcription elongation factor Spt5 [Candidatus Woesearchaeota archaeon]